MPRLVALETYVRSIARAHDFWATHFGLEPDVEGAYRLGDVIWRLLPGAEPCGTKGPHGVLPAFEIEDFGAARGYLLARGIPIVFEEMLPGLNLLIFLDPDGSPFELVQFTDPKTWDIAQRRELRTHRRKDRAPEEPLRLRPLAELTIYVTDITAGVRFYRDVVGLPVGVSFFGHVHLVLDNVPLVLRPTNTHCRAPQQPHATEAVFAVDDLDALAGRLQKAGLTLIQRTESQITVRDPSGTRVHFQKQR
ncbi:MAG: hypothetical protein GXP42_02680 [Chloroflexi bacterium]|nr:hypothetical protein [Chloroflexota bacterium]